MSLIEKLTPEQEALIPVYREKWLRIALSTERIERQNAIEAVKAAYNFIGIPEPEENIFFDSVYAALESTPFKLQRQLAKQQWWQRQNQNFSFLFPLRNNLNIPLSSL